MSNRSRTFWSIKQTAEYLSVSKKSLMRWDKEGYFASRETVTGARIYYRPDVEMAKKWLDLRDKHRKHLNKLPEIQKALDKVLIAHPLIPGQPIKFWKLEDVEAPFKAMEKWEKEEEEIMQEYSQFNAWKYGEIEREVRV